jgi:uroporphyrinogen-III synthase
VSDGDAATVAVFRPADERLTEAVDLLESLGVKPVPDPMLAVEPTGAAPAADVDVVVLTSKTGVELAAESGWSPGTARVCAIGDATAAALDRAGYDVDVIPDEFSSTGLVNALEGTIDGQRVEIARSDHGSDVLLAGLAAAGTDVHETVLYRLVRPAGAGESTELAAGGDLDAALFTSSLTVEHFLDAAADRGIRDAVVDALGSAAVTVGAIGEPTRETAESRGFVVDVVPERAAFEALADAVVDRISQAD